MRYPVSRRKDFGIILVDPKTKTGELIGHDDSLHVASNAFRDGYVLVGKHEAQDRGSERHLPFRQQDEEETLPGKRLLLNEEPDLPCPSAHKQDRGQGACD